MLTKMRLSLEETDKALPSLPLTIRVKNKLELLTALEHVHNHPHVLKGIELPSSLILYVASELQSADFSYLSINVDQPLHEDILKPLSRKDRIIDVFLPASFYHPGSLQPLKGASKIILVIEKKTDLEKVDLFISDLILVPLFPLIKGAPFCTIPIEHVYEFYEQRNAVIKKKPDACNGCIFVKFCPLQDSSFPMHPIQDAKKYKEALEFLEDEDTAARF